MNLHILNIDLEIIGVLHRQLFLFVDAEERKLRYTNLYGWLKKTPEPFVFDESAGHRTPIKGPVIETYVALYHALNGEGGWTANLRETKTFATTWTSADWRIYYVLPFGLIKWTGGCLVEVIKGDKVLWKNQMFSFRNVHLMVRHSSGGAFELICWN